jgi:hypothetical protein
VFDYFEGITRFPNGNCPIRKGLTWREKERERERERERETEGRRGREKRERESTDRVRETALHILKAFCEIEWSERAPRPETLQAPNA